MVLGACERSVVTEQRLLNVLRQSSVTHLPDVWSFVRFDGVLPSGTLAAVRDRDGWCALVTAEFPDADRFRLTSIVFPAGVDNSGFVGWLASTIKRSTGSGVFVVCGDNPGRGGIFDYIGYTIEVADAVAAFIDSLHSQPVEPASLDRRVFRVTATSPSSAVSEETMFEFRERDGVVEATYDGGGITSGRIIGRTDESGNLAMAYAQLHSDGLLHTGTSTLHREPLSDGRLRLVEAFTWSDGRQGENVLESIDPEC